jgi:hypothetical protein
VTASALLAGVWAACALATAARQLSFEPTDSARFTAWALRPELGGFWLACAISVLGAAGQLPRGPGVRRRIGTLLGATLGSAALAGSGVAHTHAREHLSGAVEHAAAQVTIRGGVPLGDARDLGDPTGIVSLPAPIWVRTWRGNGANLPNCAGLAALPPGWRQGPTPCSFRRSDGLVQVNVVVSHDTDGVPIVQVQAQPGYR